MPENINHNNLRINNVGIEWFHPAGFLVDRPEGSGDYAFVHWLTPVRIKTDGKVRFEQAGGGIVFTPGYPQWFGSDGVTPFGNNWFHFEGEGVPDLLEKYAIPLNQVIYPQHTDFVASRLRLFIRENISRDNFWEKATELNIQAFFLELARKLTSNREKPKTARLSEWEERLISFRCLLKEQCTKQWLLEDMAKEVHLSQSRFINLYREIFHISPVADLIQMRISLARYYLAMTRMPVNEIARLCGFTDVYYFSRQFKSLNNETASEFRKNHLLAQEN